MTKEEMDWVRRQVRSYVRFCPAGMEWDDLYSIGFEAYLRAQSRLKSICVDSFKAFAHTAIRNALCDLLRKQYSKNKALQFSPLEKDDVASRDRFEERVLQKIDFEQALSLLPHLHPRQRQVIELIYLQGWTAADVARWEQTGRGSVNVCHARALLKLRRLMEIQ